MNFEKENFLRTKFVKYLQQMDPSTPPRWGKMNAQQMIEHFTHDALRTANGSIPFTTIVTPLDHLTKMREFIMSNKPFRENTRNPLLGSEPRPLHFKTFEAAIGSLQEELIRFFEVYDPNPRLLIRNPLFGDLDFEQNLHLLYKHGLHHLRQFGIEPMDA